MQGTNRECADPVGTSLLPDPDIKVWRADDGGWKVEVLSSRARRWARTSFNSDPCDEVGCLVTTDLAGANSLIHRARLSGLVSEFSGRFSAVRI